MRAEGRPSPGRARAPARAAWLLASAAAVLAAIALAAPWLYAPAPGVDLEAARTVQAPPPAAPPPELGSVPRVAAAPVASPVARPADAAAAPGSSEEMVDDVEIFPAAGEPPPPDPEEEANAPYFPQPVPYEGPTGIELFPPMGTKRARAGIMVPEDFPLPEGFVRHHQVSDSGEQLPAILMVHPDYQILDEKGNPVADRSNPVVPPEYAPEGLPIQMLELPEAGG